MRIYAVADLHGRSRCLARIEAAVERLAPDVVVVAGDLTHRTAPGPVIARLAALPTRVLAIRGNTDAAVVETLLAHHARTTSLHLTEVVVDGVSFAGVSGTLPLPFSNRVGLGEARLCERLAPLVRRDTVLVAHPPPRGILDEVLGGLHTGSRRLADLVRRTRPALLLCGHIHERPGVAQLEETVVVNCSIARGEEGALIDYRPPDPPRVEML